MTVLHISAKYDVLAILTHPFICNTNTVVERALSKPVTGSFWLPLTFRKTTAFNLYNALNEQRCNRWFVRELLIRTGFRGL